MIVPAHVPVCRVTNPIFADPDYDVLTYHFEIDTASTFDSEELLASGPLPEGAGFTAWQLDAPLTTGRLYYWRVWANDGEADSERASTSFLLVPDPSMIPDAGPVADAGIDAAVVSHPPTRGGCAVTTGRSSAPWSVLALGLVIALLRRKRPTRA